MHDAASGYRHGHDPAYRRFDLVLSSPGLFDMTKSICAFFASVVLILVTACGGSTSSAGGGGEGANSANAGRLDTSFGANGWMIYDWDNESEDQVFGLGVRNSSGYGRFGSSEGTSCRRR